MILRFWRQRERAARAACGTTGRAAYSRPRAGAALLQRQDGSNADASGFEAERAYQLAQVIEREVGESGADEMSIDQLHRLVEGVLGREDTPAMLARYHGWHR